MAIYRKAGCQKWTMDFMFAGQRIVEPTGTRNKVLAERMERNRRRQLEEGAAGIRQQARPRLLSVIAADWVAAQSPKWTESTRKVHETALKHLLPVFGGQLACDTEADDIHRYQQRRLAEGASRRTINMETGTLRSVLKKSRRWAAIAEDVSFFPEDHEGKGRKLSPLEQDALLRAAGESRSPMLLPFLVLALDTGSRFGTIRTLQWGRIDFGNRSLQFGHDKTEAGSGRIVPLSQRAMAVMAHWAAQFPDRQPEHFVFPRMRIGGAGRIGRQDGRRAARFLGGVAYDLEPGQPVGDIKEAWESAKKRAGVECRFHDIRHTAASRMMDNGVPLPKVAKILGWKPSTMALMAVRYGHFDLEDLRSAVEAGMEPVPADGIQESHQFPHQFSGLNKPEVRN